MSPVDALQFGREALKEYGLPDWSMELDGAVRRFGACHYSRKLITLSYELVKLNDEDKVLDTILHEIAHALAGPGTGHGPAWKRVARSIGCTAQRCYSSARTVQPPARFILRCANCGRTSARMRVPRRPMACGACCRRFAGGRFDERFVLKWEPAGAVPRVVWPG